MSARISVFDTTLRDGEQAPGWGMNNEEKIAMARQLAKLGVDVIEAGFPISSLGDFEAVKRIAQELKNEGSPAVAGLCRASRKDIDRAWEALEGTYRPRIHTFIATSDIHMDHKLCLSPQEVLARAQKAVAHASQTGGEVEFSAEDASRSDLAFLKEIFQATLEAGASIINIPDTVGYIMPDELTEMIIDLRENVPGLDQAVISVHCHNDLGLAVANSLAAIKGGARQVECTVNGIGERAGNCAMEELVMALKTRKDFLHYHTDIDTCQIYPASRLLTQLTGVPVQPNKAVVGANAFAHEAGIHQDGMLKERRTYEIMLPDDIGIKTNQLVLGKHSGRHAFKQKLQELGLDAEQIDFEQAFSRFKSLADRKKNVYDEDVEAIALSTLKSSEHKVVLLEMEATSGTLVKPQARVKLKVNEEMLEAKGRGDGPIDAVFKVIKQLTGHTAVLIRFNAVALTSETDAQGGITVVLRDGDLVAAGSGSHTDIILASTRAYISAVNRIMNLKRRVKERQ